MDIRVEVVDVAKKFELFTETWHPRIAGELNDSYVKLVKLRGEFVWHLHEKEDVQDPIRRRGCDARLAHRPASEDDAGHADERQQPEDEG